MLLDLIRWLRGYVVFEAVGRFPERFINLCIHQGRFVFNAAPVKQKGILTGSLLLSDYRVIRPLARRSSVRLRVVERHGLPFVMSRYKDRKGLLYGAIAFVFIVIFMQSFVWTVEVKGLDTISVTGIEDKLEEKGIYVGTFKGKKNLHAIERSIMQEVNGISWMSINIIGTKAEIEIKEKEQKPHIIEADVPCNVKASCDGVIESMDIMKGSTEIPVGSAVRKGQLIVSGVVKNALDNVNFVHADARVMARTRRSERFTLKKSYKGKVISDVKCRKNLDLFGVSLPFFLSTVSEECTSQLEHFRLNLNNTLVPVGVSKETCLIYEEVSFCSDMKAAEEILRCEEALFRLFSLKDCEEIKTEFKITQNDDCYFCETEYECLEDIAVQEKIIVN